MAKKLNENVVVLEEYTTSVDVPTVGTVEHRMAAIEGRSYSKYVYRRTNTYIYVGVNLIMPTIVGKRLFNKVIPHGLTLKGSKLYGTLDTCGGVKIIRNIPKFEWLDAVPMRFELLLKDKNILKQIIRGKITSKTDLLKAAGRIRFKGDYTPKNIITLMNMSTLSVYDLNDFCKEGARGYLDRLEHIANSLKVPLRTYENLIRDLIKDHQQLGDDYYFSCKWSLERLHREHQQSILRLKQDDFDRCSTQIQVDSRYKKMLPEYVKLIDNERVACEQAIIYDNCSYRLYWPQTARGRYLLLVDSQAKVMIGIFINNGRLCIDQYHTYHNGCCAMPEWLPEYVNFHNMRLGHTEGLIQVIDEVIPF